MITKSIFSFSSYKDLMAHYLTGQSNRGQLTRAATALNCQRSYLSRVITEELHLTPDHAYNLSKFLKLSPDERNYLLTLVDFERAADSEYRGHLKGRLNEIKRKNDSLSERTHRQNVSMEAPEMHYFSSWFYSAIHFLTSIPAFQTVEALSEHLCLKENVVLRCLDFLRTHGFIEQKRNLWIYKRGEFHLPKNSPLVVLHHQNWRARALLDAQNFENNNIHFTSVQTLSREDAEKLKSVLLDFISTASLIAGPSNPETGVALMCDLFEI